MFFTCATLHNHLHMVDARDVFAAAGGVSWKVPNTDEFNGAHGADEDPDEDQTLTEHHGWNKALPMVRDLRLDHRPWRRVEAGEDFSSIGEVRVTRVLGPEPESPAPIMDIAALVALHTETDAGYNDLQTKLVAHFSARASQKHTRPAWLRSQGFLPEGEDE